MSVYPQPMPWNLKHVSEGNYVLVNRTGAPARDITIRALDDDAELWQPGLGTHGSDGITDTALIVENGEAVGKLAFALGSVPSGVIDIEWTRPIGTPPMWPDAEDELKARVTERLDARQGLTSQAPK